MLVWKIIAAIAAYFVGAINMATIVGKLKGKNIKKMGSGNPGTMNVLRSVGKLWGALTFAFDCAKGVAFALIGFVTDSVMETRPALSSRLEMEGGLPASFTE